MTTMFRPVLGLNTRTRHVFDDSFEESGSHFCAVSLEHDGRLAIETHDRGPIVQRFFGVREYDSFERFSLDQTQRLREALGDDIIGEIDRQFGSCALAFHQFVAAAGIGHGELWSRRGN